jgi:AGCS family alanine or glycine:cation symporter
MEKAREIIGFLTNLIWSTPDFFPIMVMLLLLTGLVMTVRTRFVQIRLFFHSWKVMFGVYDKPGEPGDINHFQTISAVLSATVGIGNIAGVATAIHYGGPGALFWMWVTAALGMALKYSEAMLAVKYRKQNADGPIPAVRCIISKKDSGKNGNGWRDYSPAWPESPLLVLATQFRLLRWPIRCGLILQYRPGSRDCSRQQLSALLLSAESSGSER